MTTPFGLLPSGPVEDPKLEHALDHKERAIGVLLSQLRDKPRFAKLIEILTRPFQEIEDVLWDLYIKRRLSDAPGAKLDQWGRVLLEERGGLSDDAYRGVLRVKARVLMSKGTGPNLIQICQLFLQSNSFTYDEHHPAAVEITILSGSGIPISLLAKLLRKAKSGGVRIDVIDGTGGLGTRFHYGTEGTGVGYGVGTYGGVI